MALTLVAGLVALPRPASADCATVPGNEVPAAICGFETGDPPSGWGDWVGSFARNTSVFRSGAASGQADAGEVVTSAYHAEITSSCFAITAGEGYGFGAFFRLVSGALTSGSCWSLLHWYSDDACATAPVGGFAGNWVVPSTAAWELSTASATTTATHARIGLQCQSLFTDFVIAMDDAFAGPGMTPVELTRISVD